MNLYLLTQTETIGYDTFDSCIVAAETSEQAMLTHPYGDWTQDHHLVWATSPANVKCKLIGTAIEGTKSKIILSSFNAG